MAIGSNTYTTSVKTSFVKRYDQNNTVWVEAIAHADLTRKTPYFVSVNQYGHYTQDLSDEDIFYYVGIPGRDCLEGDRIWLQIGGVCEDVITPELSASPGNVFHVNLGAITVKDDIYTRGTLEFAVCIAETTDSTVQQMLLIPEPLSSKDTGGIGL